MAQVILQMYAAGTGGTENAAANIDVPDDGTIEGIQIAHTADLDADETSTAEISFIATQQATTNDARGVLAVTALRASLVTSGLGNAVSNVHFPMDIDVAGGERLYINIGGSAGVISTIYALIYFRPRRGLPRRSARRR